MIGNNACGTRALGYGRTADTVRGLTVALGTGEVVSLPAGGEGGSPAERALLELVESHLGSVRTGFGRFSRQVSGYALEHLLPERGRRVDRFLVGSEGTLAVVLDATVDLVERPDSTLLVVLGYLTMAEAADAVPALLAAARDQDWRLVACEGLDVRIVDLVRRRRPVPELPGGSGWLFAEVTGATEQSCRAGASRLVATGGALGHRVVDDPSEAGELWRIRENGAGLAARSLDRPAHAGWEDAAVPPEHLGAWLRDFEDLLAGHGLDTVPYGHFGDGCVHARIDFTFDEARRQRFRDFLTESAVALRRYGGSVSGEHGDGRARSELLPLMYDAEAMRMFAAAKAICDPDGLLNPGVLVDPAPLDDDLRLARPRHEPPLALRLPRRRRLTRRRGPPLHRGRRLRRRPAQRRDVPVLRGDPGGEGQHPWTGAGPAGGPRRNPGRAASTTRRCTRRSTCAWPARAARATARPASTWRPTRRRCSSRPTPAGGVRAPTGCSAGCRGGWRLPAGPRRCATMRRVARDLGAGQGASPG